MGKSGTSPLQIGLMAIAFLAAVWIGKTAAESAPGWFVVVALVVVVVMVFYFLSGNKKEVALDQAAAADALAMQAPADKARVYIARHGFMASRQGMDVLIDDSHEGQFKSGRVFVADLAPGHHQVTARLARGGKGTTGTIDLDLAAGTVTVLKVSVAMGGMNGKCRLEVLPDMAAGRGHVAGNKFIAWERG